MAKISHLPFDILEIISHYHPDVGRLLVFCLKDFAFYLRKKYNLPYDILHWYKRIFRTNCPLHRKCYVSISTIICSIPATKCGDFDNRMLLAPFPSPPPFVAKQYHMKSITAYLVHSFDSTPAIIHSQIHDDYQKIEYTRDYKRNSYQTNIDKYRTFTLHYYKNKTYIYLRHNTRNLHSFYRVDCSCKSGLFANQALLPNIWCTPTKETIISFRENHKRKCQHLPISLPYCVWARFGLVHRDDGPAIICHNGQEQNYINGQSQHFGRKCIIM